MARIQQLTLARGNRGLFYVAVLAGVLTAVLVFVALAQKGGESGSSNAPAAASSVVVATQTIPAGTKITAGMVEVKQVPDNLLVPDAFANTTPVVGQVARIPLAQGEQLTPAKMGAEVQGHGLSFVVPTGKRALGIEVKQVTAVGGLLLAGDHVDIYAMVGGKPNVTYRVLQNVEVLAVAQAALEQLPRGTADLGTSGKQPKDLKEDPNAATVTVAVDPQYVPLLVCVQQDTDVKSVWLALRAFDEPAPAPDQVATFLPDCRVP